MEEEEQKRRERIIRAETKSKSWELMNLCRKLMREDGLNWKTSAERREEERKLRQEKEDRLRIAQMKQKKVQESYKCNTIQRKITDCLKDLPQNQKKLIQIEEDRLNKITLKEAKTELWKQWGQGRGRKGIPPPKISSIQVQTTPEALEKQLERVEQAVQKYKKEVEEEQERRKRKEDRLERAKRKKQHYEMLRWITEFIDKNSQSWKERRKQQLEEKEETEKQWDKLSMEEKRTRFEEEEMVKIMEKEEEKDPKLKKQIRLEQILRLKSSWRNRREERRPSEVEDDMEDEDQQGETGELLTPEKETDQEETFQQFLDEEKDGYCMLCMHKPCLCLLTKLDMKIHSLKTNPLISTTTDPPSNNYPTRSMTPGKLTHYVTPDKPELAEKSSTRSTIRPLTLGRLTPEQSCKAAKQAMDPSTDLPRPLESDKDPTPMPRPAETSVDPWTPELTPEKQNMGAVEASCLAAKQAVTPPADLLRPLEPSRNPPTMPRPVESTKDPSVNLSTTNSKAKNLESSSSPCTELKTLASKQAESAMDPSADPSTPKKSIGLKKPLPLINHPLFKTSNMARTPPQKRKSEANPTEPQTPPHSSWKKQKILNPPSPPRHLLTPKRGLAPSKPPL